MDLSFLEGLTRRELLQWIEDHIQGDPSPSLVLPAMPVDESEVRSSSDSEEPWLEFEPFDQFPFAVYVRPSAPEDCFQWISPYVVSLTGIAAECLLEEPGGWLARIHPSDRDRVQRQLECAAPGQVVEMDYRFQVRAGQWMEILDRWVGLPSKSDPQNVQKGMGAWLDVTRRKALEREVSDISEEVKQKLGRDLHDDLCQQLACVEILLHSIQRRQAKEGSAEPERLQELTHHLRKCMVTARHMACGLSTLELGQSGLSASIAHWLRSLNHLVPFQIRYESPQGWGLKEPGMAIHIYRIIQEAVQNAIKHSHGDQITVRLIPRAHELRLSIEDNGVGMAEGAASHSRGLGMKTMRYRSSLLHAQLLFEANAHGGLTLSCKIPFSIQFESPEPDS